MPGVTGASGTFASAAIVNTDATGIATAPALSANGTPGSFTVTAQVTGVASAATFSLTNVASAVTVATNVPNLSFVVDGTVYTSTQTFQWAPGSTHTLNVGLLTQGGAPGVQYVFTAWSTGSNPQTITASGASANYTANFKTQYQLTVGVSPAGAGTVSGAGFYDSGATASVSATANPGYVFAAWTGPVASATSASTTVAMNAPQSVTAGFQPVLQSIAVTPATSSVSVGKTLHVLR